MPSRLAPLLALLLLPACDAPGGTACTDLAAASVGVTVTTSDGGSLDGLTVTYSVAGGDPIACENIGQPAGDWVCGYEQAGDVTVTASLPGYADQTQTVTVGEDECHVIEEHVALVMAPVHSGCEGNPVVSVLVNLTGSTGEALDSPAVTWSADGSAPATCETADSGATWACGVNVEGDFTLSATASGHTPKDATATVPLAADGCVVTQQVDIAVDWGAD